MFIACADLHLTEKKPAYRIEEDWMSVCLGKLQQVLDKATEYECDVYIAGDLFDKSAHSPELINAVMSMFEIFKHYITIIPGQHDIKNHNLELIYKSSIGTINYLKNILVIGKSFNGNDDKDFFPFGSDLKYLGGDIAFIHQLAYKEKPWAGVSKSGNYKRIINKMKGYRLIIAGDHHLPFIAMYNNCTFLNCGSMLRTDRDQIDHKPAFYFVSDDLSIETIPYKIRNKVFDTSAIKLIEKKDQAISEVAEQMKMDIQVNLNFKKNMTKYLDRNKINESVKDIIKEAMEDEK